MLIRRTGRWRGLPGTGIQRCGLVCGFDFDGSMQSQCASSTPEPRALVSVAGSAKLRSLNCQIVSMVQFSGQVVDMQWCSKKIWRKKVQFGAEKVQFSILDCGWRIGATPTEAAVPTSLGDVRASLPRLLRWFVVFVIVFLLHALDAY